MPPHKADRSRHSTEKGGTGPSAADAPAVGVPGVDIDFDAFTLDDLAELEELTGVSIDDLKGADAPKLKVLKALAFIVMRRNDPDLTFEAVGKIPFAKLNFGAAPTGE